MSGRSLTDSPSGTFDRCQFGASEQLSCAAGPDGLRTCFPANESMPTRGGEAVAASPFRPVGPYAEHIVRGLARHLHNRAIDEAATKEAMALGSRVQRREG
ncbi:hypothetical protein ASG54_21795 [Aureimonas sp. Leaf460]|nr:hypothetical protein ASG62_16160 [Aureimonas sp. Leaf427]KQT70577.1 hypothetical protein ASG54_21795 [Aureimonas sp. Leaf460]